jgi:hypothetical protein
MDSSPTSQQALATLAAAIIAIRRDASVPGVRDALRDAGYLLNPDTSSADYKKWKASHLPE